jgi:hypothetical protein
MEQAADKCINRMHFRIWRDYVSGRMEMRFLNEERMQLRVVLIIQ